MSDDRVLGCARVDTAGAVASGSVKRVCQDCGAAVWVAPSGVALIAREGVVPTCMRCVAERVRKDPEPKFVGPNAQQLAEILAYQRRN